MEWKRKLCSIPPKSPPEIKKLGQLLDTLIYFSTFKKIDSFSTKEYKEELSRFDLEMSGELLKIERRKVEK